MADGRWTKWTIHTRMEKTIHYAVPSAELEENAIHFAVEPSEVYILGACPGFRL